MLAVLILIWLLVAAPASGWWSDSHGILTRASDLAVPEELPPLDLSVGTKLQQQLWHALMHISIGSTCTYGELARALRRPKAARAIGCACGANPIPVLIPCHRVIGASGGLTGFSGGMHWKAKLLEIERAKLPLH